jgi:hypothetical protein
LAVPRPRDATSDFFIIRVTSLSLVLLALTLTGDELKDKPRRHRFKPVKQELRLS